jgi:hypothetical protein
VQGIHADHDRADHRHHVLGLDLGVDDAASNRPGMLPVAFAKASSVMYRLMSSNAGEHADREMDSRPGRQTIRDAARAAVTE